MLSVLFFILLADAMLSDWVPAFMQESMGSSMLMGLVMAFSSLIGFGADLLFPQLLRGVGVKKLLFFAIVVGGLFASTLMLSTLRPYIVVFLVAMALWGVYYEFLGFANQQFVAETAPVHDRAKVWAVMGVFRNLAYLLGPLLGGWLVGFGNNVVVGVSGGITLVAMLMIFFSRMGKREAVLEPAHINLGMEIAHWKTLLVHVWPIIVMSLVIGLVDATYWTTGTVFNDMLAKNAWYGGFFLSVFTLPSLFVGLLVAKWGIYKGKKKWGERFMLLSGLVLSMMGMFDNTLWYLGVVFISSCLLSGAIPLIDAVYSDVIARMGHERKHMVGLSSSTVSLAYIIGPIIAGWISSMVGERQTFVVMGMVLAIVATVLLLTTPKKLRLPQVEMASWE